MHVRFAALLEQCSASRTVDDVVGKVGVGVDGLVGKVGVGVSCAIHDWVFSASSQSNVTRDRPLLSMPHTLDGRFSDLATAG